MSDKASTKGTTVNSTAYSEARQRDIAYLEARRRTIKKHLDVLEGVERLASANFPRSSDLRIETVGCDPKASVSIPAWLLADLIKMARDNLEATKQDAAA